MARRAKVGGAIGAWLRNYVFVPSYAVGTSHRLRSDDGVELHAVRLAGPEGCGVTVLLVPGLGHWHRHRKVFEFAHALATHANVVVLDLRGHGYSHGVSTLGAEEYRDVAAAATLVPRGDAFVLVGMSMGSAAALMYAATAGADERRPDALVSISGPAWWLPERPRAVLDRLVAAANAALMRVGMRVFMRARVNTGRDPRWRDPVDYVARLAPMPLLIVHDRRDWYFGADQVEALARAGGPNVTVLWRDGGHATDLLGPELYDEIVRRVIRQRSGAGDTASKTP